MQAQNPWRRGLRALANVGHDHPWPLLLAALFSAVMACLYAVDRLGINTDTADMISPSLAWRQDYIAYQDAFPHQSNLVILVVEGGHGARSGELVSELAERLAGNDRLVEWAYAPEQEPFFQRQGLLYLSLDELDALALRLNSAQPLLGGLAQAPELATILGLMQQGLTVTGDSRLQAEQGGAAAGLDVLAKRLTASIGALLLDGDEPLPWRWRDLLSGEAGTGGADAQPGAPDRELLLVRPRLDFSNPLPLNPFLDVLDVELTSLRSAYGEIDVRVTGGIAMSNEELKSVSQGMGMAGLGALVVVTLILILGLGSVRLVLACLLTLVVGLSWTAAFAAEAVGHLNLISVAFAVLYVGLGVDYAVHYAMRYREAVRADGVADGGRNALQTAGEQTGGTLALCALTTGVGFYAFVPTEFAGVAELGLISGTGMFISLFATVLLMPAALTVFGGPEAVPPSRPAAGNGMAPPAPPAPDGLGWLAAVWQPGRRWAVLGVTGVAAGLALASVTRVAFDDNPINLRDVEGEAVATYLDLLEDPERGLWSLRVLLPADDENQLAELAERLAALPEVKQTRALTDLVPVQQDEKLELLEELDLSLALPPVVVGGQPEGDRARQLSAALSALRDAIATAQPGGPWPALAAALEALATQGDAVSTERLLALERSVLGDFVPTYETLLTALSAEPVTTGDLPERVLERWIGTAGQQVLEVQPAADLTVRAHRDAFVAAVKSVAPTATGTPVVHLESGRAVVSAFIQAFICAVALIALIALVVLRRLGDVVAVTLPLVLALLFTAAVMVVIDQPFNFANVIVLPLLLGMGVDNGLHLVGRLRAGNGGQESPAAAVRALAASSTPRAVLVSTLTTVASFGNLALSPHPGTASMGLVLTIGMIVTLITTVALSPCLVRHAPERSREVTR